MKNTMELYGKTYKIVRTVETESATLPPEVPLIEMKQMSDYEWQRQALEDRIANPDKYRIYLGEDVDAVIKMLTKWLDENKEV